MRSIGRVGSALAGLAIIAGCQDNPVTPASLSGPSLAISAGAVVSYVSITSPSTATKTIAVGSTAQMVAKVFYNTGGTMPAIPYGQWRTTNECVASVTNGANNSWGLVSGVSSGSALIIVEAFGKADTVAVTVTGNGNLDPTCLDRQWIWNLNDISFTGKAKGGYRVKAGETLAKVVLFAGPKPDYTISRGKTVTLRSELWYSGGGRLAGMGYVTYSTTNPAVATINASGVATGLTAGRTKVIARIGTSFADTVPLYVR